MFISPPLTEYFISPPLDQPYVSPPLNQPESEPTTLFGGSIPAVHCRPVKLQLHPVGTRVYYVTASWFPSVSAQTAGQSPQGSGSQVDLLG